MKAQMNATGQSRPPVAIPIQLVAFMAAAWGWPHFRASCPGNCPNMTTITPTPIRMAKTTKAKASKRPNEESIVNALSLQRNQDFRSVRARG
jgi:hypothetical protein